ncbi:hypothetical protein SVAN01_02863 [Stagonosporopsis vannaccii]|nr:hypothetical protein SVAN01_02863 [Stagonosporopsis vannaccii]
MKSPEFFFDPKGGWNDCHGDGKATTKGVFIAQTMTTTGDTPQYRVQVVLVKFNYRVLGPIVLEPGPDGQRPSDDDVLNVLREAVKLLRK